MACKVEEVKASDGKPSVLFASLAKVYPQELALSKYLSILSNSESFIELYGKTSQGEPNVTVSSETRFKRDEFSSTEEQYAVIDRLALLSLDVIKSFKGVKDDTVISGINGDALAKIPDLSGRIVKGVRASLSKSIGAPGKSKYTIELLEAASKFLPSYLITDNRAGLVGRVLRDEYGISFRSKRQENFLDTVSNEKENNGESFDLELESIQSERIYDMDTTEQSIMTGINGAVVAYLRSKRKVTDDYKFILDGSGIKYEKSSIGTNKPADFQKLFSTLQGILVGVQSVPEMKKRLLDAVATNPVIAPVILDIVTEDQQRGVMVKTSRTTVPYKPLSTALFATFSKADYNMYTIVRDTKGAVLMLPANRSSVQGLIKSRVATEIVKLQKNPDRALIDARSLANTAAKIKNTSFKGSDLVLLSRQFKAAGMYFATPEYLTHIYDIITTNPPKKLLKNITPALAVRTFFKGALIPVLKGEDIFNTSPGNFYETRLLNFFIKEASKFETDQYAGAYSSNTGKLVHPINKSSEAFDIFKRAKNSSEYLDQFNSDPIYENSLIINSLYNDTDPDMLRQFTMDSVADSSIKNSGLKYGKLSPFDALVSKIVGFESTPSTPTVFYASSPTFADRSTSISLVVDKKNVSPEGVNKEVISYDKNGTPTLVKGTKENPSEIYSWIENQISTELNRIIASRKIKTDYKSYNKNSQKIMLFEQLNGILDLPNLTSRNKGKFLAQAMENMSEIFSDIMKEDIQAMVDARIINKTPLTKIGQPTKYTNPKDSNKYLPASFKNPSREKVQNFIANNLIYNYEQLLFYAGDIAFYKSKIDLNKRLGLITTPGNKLAVGAGSGVSRTYKMLQIVEPVFKSLNKYLYDGLFTEGAYKKVNGSTAKSRAELFALIESADGSGFVSPARYKELLMGQGLHNQATLEYLDALSAWKPGKKRIVKPDGAATPVLKGFQMQIRQANGIMVPTSQKYSIMLVVPDYFEATENGRKEGVLKHSGMAAISRALREGIADEVAVTSAVKVGVNNAMTLGSLNKQFDNPSIIPTTTMYNESYRFPQVATNKKDIKSRWGSQVRKLIAAHMDPIKNVRVKGRGLIPQKEARETYEEAIKSIVKKNSLELTARYINEGLLDEGEIRDALITSLDGGGTYKNVEFFEEALALLKGKTFMPLNYPSLAFAVDSMTNSAYRNSTHRFKTPGYQAVQVTSMGMEASTSKGEVSTDSDLKFIGLKRVDGIKLSAKEELALVERIKNGEDVNKTDRNGTLLGPEIILTPAEVRVTEKYFKNTIKKLVEDSIPKDKFNDFLKSHGKRIKKENPKLTDYEVSGQLIEMRKVGMYEEAKMRYNKIVSKLSDKSGVLDIEKLRANNPELLDLVLYRIPTQAKSSMLPAMIVGFIPESLGSTVQVPAEIVEQAGSDFDIDKVFVQSKGVSLLPNNTLETLTDSPENAIFDFEYGVLTSPNHFQDLLLPTGTVQLEGILSDFNFTDDLYSGNVGSLKVQEAFRDSNKKGKELIGVFSINSTAHAVAAYIGAKTKASVVINNHVLKLGSEYSLDGKFKIADSIKELQNGALDNANNPILGNLNVDINTASVVGMLVSAGHSMDYALSILNAPIVREYATLLPIYEKLKGAKSANESTVKTLHTKFNIDSKLKKSNTNLKSYSKEKADANRLATDSDANFPASQREALSAFLQIKELADKFASFQQALNFDSSGTESSASRLMDQISRLEDIQGTVSSRNKTQDPGTKKVNILSFFTDDTDSQPFEIDPMLYDQHSISSYERYGIRAASKVNRLTSLAASDIGVRLVKTAEDSIGFMTSNQKTHFLSEFNSFISHTSGVYSDLNSSISEMIKNNEHLKLIDKNDGASVGDQIEKFRQREESSSIKNEFIRQLVVVEVEGNSFVTFNNTKFKALTGSTQAELMRSFESLMDSDLSMDRLLAKSIADYAAIFYGFAKSPNSFMDVLPPRAHSEYMGAEEGVSLIEFFRSFKKDINNADKFNKINEDYVDHYIAKNASKFGLETLSDNDVALRLAHGKTGLPAYYIVSGPGKAVIKSSTGEVLQGGGALSDYIKTYELDKTPTEIKKSNTSQSNKDAQKNLKAAFVTFKDHFDDLLNMPVKTARQLSENVNGIFERINSLTEDVVLSSEEKQDIVAIFDRNSEAKSLKYLVKLGKTTRTLSEEYNDFRNESLNEISKLGILNILQDRIKNCKA